MSTTNTTKGLGRIKDLDHVKFGNLLMIDVDWIDPHPDNLRSQDDEYKAHIQSFVEMLEAGNSVPPIMLQRNGPDRFYSLDGSTRLAAAKIHKKQQNLAEFRLPGMLFPGNDQDAEVFMVKANTGKRFRPIELLPRYKKWSSTYGWDAQEIARQTGFSVAHVLDVLTLGQADAKVLDMVREEKVAAGTVVKLVRAQGAAETTKTLVEAAATPEAEKTGKVMPRHVPALKRTPAGTGRNGALDALLTELGDGLSDEDFAGSSFSVSGSTLEKVLKALGYQGRS